MLDGLSRAISVHPAVLLEGPRGVGKTMLARELIESERLTHYVTLTDPSVASQAWDDPDRFAASLPNRTIVDDVHLAPEVTQALGRLADRIGEPGTFLAVGFPQRPGADNPARQLHRVRLGSFTQSELRGSIGRFVTAVFNGDPATWPFEALALDDYLAMAIAGGVPSACERSGRADDAEPYAALVVELLGRSGTVGERERLRRVFTHIVSRPSGRVHLERVAEELGCEPDELEADIDRLVALHAVRRLGPWSRFRKATSADALRVHAADPGFCAHALGVRDGGDAAPAQAAVLLHALVAHEIDTQNSWLRNPVDVTFWRSRPQQFEVDFLLENRAGAVVPILVTASDAPMAADLAGIDAFRRRHPRAFRRGILLYPGDRVLALGEDRWAVPLSTLWTMAESQSPLDVGTFDSELDAATKALRQLVERARPTDLETARRQAALEEAMRTSLAPRLERIATVLTGVGLTVGRIEVGEVVTPDHRRTTDVAATSPVPPVPAWLSELASTFVAHAADVSDTILVAGLSVGVGGRTEEDAPWAAAVVACLARDGNVAWRAGHAVRPMASAERSAATVVGLVGPLTSRHDEPIDTLADQLSASLAASLPDAMAQLAASERAA
jgi:predicted AAA+ superfamily ATPase